jgi:hypothetical protein
MATSFFRLEEIMFLNSGTTQTIGTAGSFVAMEPAQIYISIKSSSTGCVQLLLTKFKRQFKR